MSFLELSKVNFSYGKDKIVENFNLRLERGEIHCLLGPSGCGKSTILHLIAGFLPVNDGRIELDGQIFDQKSVDGTHFFIPPEKRQLGIVFQEPCLFPHLNVEKNIGFGGPGQSRLQDWMELIGLAHKQESYPQELSGGEQQRVAIARAMVSRPRVLLMDEPFSALDVNLRAKLRRQVKQWLRSLQLTALIVTHSHREAFELGDRITLMGHPTGHLLGHQTGRPQDFFFRPRTSALVDFMKSGILLPGQTEGGPSARVDGVGQFEISNPDDIRNCREIYLFIPFHQLSLFSGAIPLGTAKVISSYSHGPECIYSLQKGLPTSFFEMKVSCEHKSYAEGDEVQLYLKSRTALWAMGR